MTLNAQIARFLTLHLSLVLFVGISFLSIKDGVKKPDPTAIALSSAK
jgi:hypothetical protein